MIGRTRARGASRGRGWCATVACDDLPLSVGAVPSIHHYGMYVEGGSVVNAGPGTNQSDDTKFAIRLRADIAHRILPDFGVVEKIQPIRPLGHEFTVPTVKREFRRHQRFQLRVVLGIHGVAPSLG